MIVLDTSVIVRAAVSPVTPDDRVMHATSSEFFRRAALGTELFTTSEAVLADVAHVLQKLYG